MDPAQRQAVESFKEITQCSDQEAKFFLEANGWDVESATVTFFSGHQPPSPVHPSASGVAAQAPISQPQPKSAPPPARQGGVKGFSDYAEKAAEDDSKTTKWYTGGEKSGLQVEAPPSNKDEIIDDVMKKAQEMGGVLPSEYVSPDAAPFSGGGFRLGNTTVPSAPIAPAKPKERRLKITLWKNGFTVDDQPLRDFNSPMNKKFLDDIKQGVIPQELQAQLRAEPPGSVSVDLIDSRGQDYTPPPKVFTSFTGSGQKLGSTSISTTPTTTTAAPTPKQVVLDESQPTTSLQIRLADGTKLVAKFNHTHTVRDVRAYINSAQTQGGNFDLMTTFPQKVLSDESQSLKEAGLINSVVVQKMK